MFGITQKQVGNVIDSNIGNIAEITKDSGCCLCCLFNSKIVQLLTDNYYPAVDMRIFAKSGPFEHFIPEQTEHMIPEMTEHLKPKLKHHNINSKQ